jgi:hypothetical protein
MVRERAEKRRVGKEGEGKGKEAWGWESGCITGVHAVL